MDFRIADPFTDVSFGAGGRSRTLDLRITNALLYQLSYTGIFEGVRTTRGKPLIITFRAVETI